MKIESFATFFDGKMQRIDEKKSVKTMRSLAGCDHFFRATRAEGVHQEAGLQHWSPETEGRPPRFTVNAGPVTPSDRPN